MICPKCHGKRGDYVMAYWKWHGGPTWDECWYCRGEGNVHCCEGDCEQPDPNREESVYYRREEC